MLLNLSGKIMSVNKISPQAALLYPELQKSAITKKSTYTDSSIAKKTIPSSYDYTTSRPKLSYQLIEVHDMHLQVTNAALNQETDMMVQSLEELQKLSSDLIEKNSALEESENRYGVWSQLNGMVSVISASISCFLGGRFISDEATKSFGYLLTACGLGDFFNEAMHSNGWQWLASKVTSDTDFSVTLASGMHMATSVLSKIVLFFVGSFLAPQALALDSSAILKTAQALTQGILALGEGISTKKISDAQEEQLKALYINKEQKALVDQILKQVEFLNGQAVHSAEETAKIIHMLSALYTSFLD